MICKVVVFMFKKKITSLLSVAFVALFVIPIAQNRSFAENGSIVAGELTKKLVEEFDKKLPRMLEENLPSDITSEQGIELGNKLSGESLQELISAVADRLSNTKSEKTPASAKKPRPRRNTKPYMF